MGPVLFGPGRVDHVLRPANNALRGEIVRLVLKRVPWNIENKKYSLIEILSFTRFSSLVIGFIMHQRDKAHNKQ